MRLQDDEVLLAADRHVRVDEVAEPQQQVAGLRVRLVLGRVRRLHIGLELLGPGQEPGALLGRGLGDKFAERFLLGTQYVERDPGRPAPFVGGEQGVDECDVLSPVALGGAKTVGVLTNQAKVNHLSRLPVSASLA